MQFREIGNEQAWALVGMSKEENEGNHWVEGDATALESDPVWAEFLRESTNQIRIAASAEQQYAALVRLAGKLFAAGRLAEADDFGPPSLPLIWSLLGEDEDVRCLINTDTARVIAAACRSRFAEQLRGSLCGEQPEVLLYEDDFGLWAGQSRPSPFICRRCIPPRSTRV